MDEVFYQCSDCGEYFDDLDYDLICPNCHGELIPIVDDYLGKFGD